MARKVSQDKIEGLMVEGFSYSDIARICGVSRQAIHYRACRKEFIPKGPPYERKQYEYILDGLDVCRFKQCRRKETENKGFCIEHKYILKYLEKIKNL